MKILFLIIALLTLFSCSTPSVQVEKETKDLYFPWGTYQQKINIVQPKGKNKFSGVMVSREDSFALHAFGPFGVKIFTLKENFSNQKIEIISEVESIQDKKDFILKLYPVIKKTFLLSKKEVAEMKEFNHQLDFPLGKVHVKLDIKSYSEYEVVIEKENYFNFTIAND